MRSQIHHPSPLSSVLLERPQPVIRRSGFQHIEFPKCLASTRVFFGLIALALITGCSNKIVIPEQACVFKDGSQTVAPDWLCLKTTRPDQRYAIGYAAPSITGPDFSEKMAINAATNKLMRSLWQDLQISIERWHAGVIKQPKKSQSEQLQDNQVATASQNNQSAQLSDTQAVTASQLSLSLRQYLSAPDLEHIQVLQSVQTPNGGMAVAIELDRVGLINILQPILSTAVQQQPRLWQAITDQMPISEIIIALIDQLPPKQ